MESLDSVNRIVCVYGACVLVFVKKKKDISSLHFVRASSVAFFAFNDRKNEIYSRQDKQNCLLD